MDFDPEVWGRKEGRWFQGRYPEDCQTKEQYEFEGRDILGENAFKDDPERKKLELWMKGWCSAWQCSGHSNRDGF